MKKVLLICTLLFTVILIKAQPEDKKISKITFMMVDGKYEDAAFKCQKLLEDSEYRKNGWVHFYLSEALFEIAKDPAKSIDYPKAMKDALKYAYKLNKYKNKPAENKEIYENALEYLAKLKDSAITISEIYYDNNNPRKAAYYLGRVVKFDPDDYAVWLMKGVYEIKSRNVGEGVKSIMLAMDSLSMDYQPDEVSVQTLVDALDEYALIVKSGEYDQYFKAYKFEPTSSDVQNALAMKEEFQKLIKGEVVDKEERKKESEIIFKTFRSDVEDEEDDDDE